ncbi:mucin-binding protein [Limosilactobacillus sp.]|jgi:LPXTG-motif cell wall-anchored protein|uniref:mucin-binding protein n=1 Tax=Limosilactobacillus sp. TaxID=2773925 RepID=UPI0025BF4E20|nr:YSIRK-type signal peptide-containing protein [Limosilactobacillus sp.]MCH3922094.1 YSIRK-type signal peptide-containing protein [Limosilactobacillus sp.]MCH3928865.1 YSIRK-type signal peptide-containing protein [Limosilactobacillus sp.]
MVGKNNHYLKESKNNQKYQRFSLRKFSIGVVSVAIAAGFYLGSSQSVMADTTTQAAQTSESTVAVSTSGSTASDSSEVTQASSATTTKTSASANASEAATTPTTTESSAASASDDAATMTLSTKTPVTSITALADSKTQTPTVAKTAHNNTENQAVNNTDEVTVTIIYKDETTGKTLDTETVSGKAGQKIKFNNQKILDYRNLHYKYNDSNLDKLIYRVDVKEYTISFTHRTKPDTKNVKVTRTINVTKPDGSVTTTTQIVNSTGKGTKDLVTNETTWNSWTTGTWAEFDTPTISGYTPSQTTVAAEEVNGTTADQIVKITYTADELTATITYKDDTTGQILGTETATGKVGQKIDFNNNQKILDYRNAGYAYRKTDLDGQTYQVNGQKDFTVHFTHKTETVTKNVTVTRTIRYVYSDRKEAAKDVVQTLTFKQTGTKDLVTGQTTWNNVADQDFAAVDSPVIAGYTANKATVAQESANVDTKSSELTVTYKASDADAMITYVDEATGKTIKTEKASGKVGQKIVFATYPGYQIKLLEQQGYELGPNDFRFEGEYYSSDSAKNHFTVHLNHGKKADVENKTITRTINVTNPDGAVKTTKQVAELSRMVTKDAVTGDVLETGDWTTGSWAEFDTPTISNYTPSQATVAAEKVDNNTKDQVVNITYTANEQTATITYVDDTDHKGMRTDNAIGKFGQQIVFANDPGKQILAYRDAGYVYQDTDFNNQAYQSDNAKNAYVVHFTHKTQTFTPAYNPNGYDLSRNATYTIHYVFADGKQNDYNVVQQSILGAVTRTATLDEATGEVTYGNWKVNSRFAQISTPERPGYTPDKAQSNGFTPVVDGQSLMLDGDETVTYYPDSVKSDAKLYTRTIHYVDEHGNELFGDTVQSVTFNKSTETDYNGNVINDGAWVSDHNQFDAVVAPTKDGYTADQAQVDQLAIDANDSNQKHEVTIVYHANKQTATITYVDDATGKAIKTETVNGKVGQKIVFATYPGYQIKLLEQQGYELGPNDFRFEGEYYSSDSAKNHFTVHLNHGKKADVDTKTITRTINVTNPDGTVKTTKQAAELSRMVTKDAVTGDVLETGDWTTGAWDEFDTPTIPGYTPSQASVAQQTVTSTTPDTTIAITYTADAKPVKQGDVTIKYVDQDGNEISRQVISGNVGDTIKVTPEIPAGWEPADPSTVPSEVTIREENGQIIIVVIKHAVQDPTETKTVTRTINVTTPDGQTTTTKQTVTLTRSGDLDLVTGQTTWGDWTTGTWQDFKPAAIAGYTPSQSDVPEVTVDGDTMDQVINITYTADQQTPVDPGQTTDPVEPAKPADHDADTSQPGDHNTDTSQPTDPDFDAHYRNADAAPDDSNQQDDATTSEAPVSEAPVASTSAAQAKYAPTTDPNGATLTGITVRGTAKSTTSTDAQRASNAAAPTDTTSANERATSQRLPQTGNADSTALVGLGFASLLTMFGLLGSKKNKQD